MSEYDLTKGQQNLEDALERNDRVIDPAWKEEALVAIRLVARQKAEFTADDVWQTGLDEPSNPKALGNVMLVAKREGVAMKTGRVVTTARVSRNAGDVAVWRSLLFKG